MYKSPSQCYGASPAIWNHTVLPATGERARLSPSPKNQYSIYLLQKDRSLSWPWWLIIYLDGYIPIHVTTTTL